MTLPDFMNFLIDLRSEVRRLHSNGILEILPSLNARRTQMNHCPIFPKFTFEIRVECGEVFEFHSGPISQAIQGSSVTETHGPSLFIEDELLHFILNMEDGSL